MRLYLLPFIDALTLICFLSPAGGTSLFEWNVRDSPTTETLNGIAAGNNLLIAVGNAGTLLTSADGANWTATASGTTADLYDVAGAPPSCAISGREVVLEWDGVTTPVPIVESAGGEAFTPVMPTTSSVWFGEPDFGIGFSFLYRYDRTLGDASGIVTPGPVLELCVPPGGSSIVFVTTYGDVIELDESFSQTIRHDQDDFDVLDLVAADFTDDCSRILASHRETPIDFRVLEFAPTPLAAGMPNKQGEENEWVHRAALLPAGLEITMVGYILNKDVGVDVHSVVYTWDGATKKASVFHFDGAVYREVTNIEIAKQLIDQADFHVFDEDLSKTRSGSEYVTAAQDKIQILIAVGTGGAIVGATYAPSIFSDGFESGDLSEWIASP